MSSGKTSLLEKFNIPLNHLEFDYIKSCRNSKELEKIYRILISGEQGYFEELTKCAKECLQKLKPDSKWLRIEEQLMNKNNFEKEEWNELSNSFVVSIKQNLINVNVLNIH